MDKTAREEWQAQWQRDDIHEYDGRREGGGGWCVRVDTLTMDVLVCMRGVPCPFEGGPGDLPGLMIDGERWVPEFVAGVTLCLLDRMRDVVGLELDLAAARIEAMEGLRQRGRKVREMAEHAQRNYEEAERKLHETRQKLGLLPPGAPPERLPS